MTAPDPLIVRLWESLWRDDRRDPLRLALSSALEFTIRTTELRATFAEVRALVASMKAELDARSS